MTSYEEQRNDARCDLLNEINGELLGSTKTKVLSKLKKHNDEWNDEMDLDTVYEHFKMTAEETYCETEDDKKLVKRLLKQARQTLDIRR